jgi:hypothetical protein
MLNPSLMIQFLRRHYLLAIVSVLVLAGLPTVAQEGEASAVPCSKESPKSPATPDGPTTTGRWSALGGTLTRCLPSERRNDPFSREKKGYNTLIQQTYKIERNRTS